MSFFKRTFSGIYARIDSLVGEIENHDALIRAAIAEQQSKIAKAKVQLRRLQASARNTKDRIQNLEEDEQRWQQRAVNEAASDEKRALTCLQRRQQVQQQLQKYRGMLEQYQCNIEKLSADIRQCEEALRTMKQKHEVLRARETTADAVKVINADIGTSLDDIEQSFDRWEVKIAQGELCNESITGDTTCGLDNLEAEYLQEENEQQLRAELAELLKAQPSDGHKGE